MHIYTHKSGLRAFLIPKGVSSKNAAFATHYGSINNEFVIPGGTDSERVPDGIAHFLEHKLFEQEDGNAMEKFGELGASPNAYTGFNQTVYLFSATDRFGECFKLLLDFVQNPHLTEESIEREKGIIGQEIRMYQDDPNWRVFFNLLNAMYKNNPVRVEIAGTMESISHINRELLYKCYRTFYHPSNMILLAVGDIEPEEVFGIVDESIREEGTAGETAGETTRETAMETAGETTRETAMETAGQTAMETAGQTAGQTARETAGQTTGEIKRIFPEREKKVASNYIEQQLAVSTPLFNMGIMDPSVFETGAGLITYETSAKILLDMIVGRSSQLHEDLYGEGLINSTLDMDCNIEKEYAFSIIGGESRDPVQVRDRIVQHIDELKKKGINREDFERSRNAMMGRFVRQFNSVEKISHSFISVFFKGVYLFDYFDVYGKISFEDVSEVFDRHFNADNLTLSVIKPV